MKQSNDLAYIVGVALGDGNLSCPNGRTTRLRVTCDSRYPMLAEEIRISLRKLFPYNKVSDCPSGKSSYFNISVYSNSLNECLPWQVNCGSKQKQNAHVPNWILHNPDYKKHCLRCLLQTDGSVYSDRGYVMVNFTNNIKLLAEDVSNMISDLGFSSHFYETMQASGNLKYTVRLSKQTQSFIKMISLQKR